MAAGSAPSETFAVLEPISLQTTTTGHASVFIHTGGTPASNTAVVVDRDFNDLFLDGWTTESGTWSAKCGYLSPDDATVESRIWTSQTASNADIWFSYRQGDVSDSSLVSDCVIRASGATGSRVRLLLMPTVARLIEESGAGTLTLAECNWATVADAWYDVRVLTNGAHITVWRGLRNEPMQQLMDGTASVLNTAYLGFGASAHAKPAFDNIRVMSFTDNVYFPPYGELAYGQSVQLAVMPAPKWSFDGWSGGASGSENPYGLVIAGPVTVNAICSRPQVHLTLQVPGGHGSTVPGPGDHLVNLGDSVTIVSQPEADYAHDYWLGPLDSGIDPRQATVTIPIVKDTAIVAKLVARPGMEAINMLSDMAYFLSQIPDASGSTVETFDKNEVEYDDLGRVQTANGVPDSAELYLLEAVLKNRRLDLSGQSGVANDPVWEAWEQNVSRAQQDFPTQDPRVQRVIAGYLTLGDFGSAAFIEEVNESTFSSSTFAPGLYNRVAQRWLRAEADADNDGVSNREEWEVASPNASLSAVASFADAATNGVRPPTTPPTTPSGQPPCQNCANQLATATAVAIPSHGEGLLQDPEAYNDAIQKPDGNSFLPGTRMEVLAVQDTDHGYTLLNWLAPGSMLDGSRLLKDSYPLMGSTGAVAIMSRWRMEIPFDTQQFTIHIAGEGGAKEVLRDGHRYIQGPPKATVRLKAVSSDPQWHVVSWHVTDGVGYADPRAQLGDTVTMHLSGYARPGLVPTSVAYTDTKSISLRSSQGGYVSGAISLGWGGAFVNSIITTVGQCVNFAALPNPEFEFAGWDGYDDDWFIDYMSSSEVSDVFARFVLNDEHTLNIATSIKKGTPNLPSNPNCAGYVTADPPQKYYRSSAIVTLTAHCGPEYVLDKWEGDGEDINGVKLKDVPVPLETDNQVQVVMNTDRTVTAVFKHEPVRVYQAIWGVSEWGNEPTILRMRRILETGGDEDGDGIPDNVALITADPAMPDLYAHVPNGISAATWLLHVRYARHRAVPDEAYFPFFTESAEPAHPGPYYYARGGMAHYR